MKTETNHRPTQWKYISHDVDGFKFLIQRQDGSCVASIWPNGDDKETEAYAAFIVQAVNAHADLIAALEGLMWRFNTDNPDDDELDIKIARAALAKAKEA